MDYAPNTLEIGKAGELRVRAELILRGFAAAVFDIDTGVDIILENGKRLQIKTSLQPNYSKAAYSWRYTFTVRAMQLRIKGNGLYEKRHTRRNYNGRVDYFIFYLVKDNIFYIIPEKEIGEKVSFSIATPEDKRIYKKHINKISMSKYEQYKNNWEQLR